MDGGQGSSRHNHDPEGLLRSALEKIVFFECRVSQLESELGAAQAGAERARGEASTSRRREVELEQALAGEKGARGDAERRAAEAEDRVRLLAAERERLLGGLVERARLEGAPGSSGAPAPDEGQADLAGFIAELRAEIESLRSFKASAVAAGYAEGGSSSLEAGGASGASASSTAGGGAGPSSLSLRAAAGGADTPSPALRAAGGVGSSSPSPREAGGGSGRGASSTASVAELAGRFETQGRVGISSADRARLANVLATRADRALYERSMDDLSAPDAGKRVRAVRALEALGARAAAPLLAAALSRESDAEVKGALLAALARFKEPFVAALAERELADPRPAVRVAALEALATVGPERAAERLSAALSDESPVVRRRAALLLGFTAGDRAVEALAVALCDTDRGVARAAAAALSGRPSARAQSALARGLEHPELSVRRAAATALGRLAGEVVDADGTASSRRASSRRIAERLASMDGEELRAAVLRSAETERVTERVVVATTVRVERPVGSTTSARTPDLVLAHTAGEGAIASASASIRAGNITSLSPTGGEGRGEGATSIAPRTRTAVAVVDAPPPGAPDLEPRVVAELRAALRGATEGGLASALGAPSDRVAVALASLAARGAVERRGTRWYVS